MPLRRRRHRAIVVIAGISLTCVPTPPQAKVYAAVQAAERPAGCAPDAVTGEMIHIPAGRFEMGNALGDTDEGPLRLLEMPAYEIDRTEVTVRSYAACVLAGLCEEPNKDVYCNWGPRARNALHPMNCVGWYEAARFCAWAGKRLPSEEEWEYAARGPTSRRFPWGEAYPGMKACWDGEEADLAQGMRRGTCAVATHPLGRSPFGVEDMAGNVLEWTQAIYSEHPDAKGNPGLRVTRGGSWVTFEARDLRASLRMRAPAMRRDFTVGFRCAR